ncbi:MAG: T9SS type A sorting domain-containing protein [Crocinitomicaceae bacterium]|nr:T9SS type A sorting domain-containing protein [Crocinitomicaceae bacterium]
MSKLGLLSFVLFFSCQLFSQNNNFPCSSKSKHTNQTKISPYTTSAQATQQKKYDVYFYRLSLNMTNTVTTLSGVVEIHAKATQVIDSALLEFFNGFTINSVKVNGVTANYSRYNQLLSVYLNLPQGSDFIISIDYQGTPPTAATNPLGGAGMSCQASPSWGNNVTWSLSEPFSAFEWFPCKQDLKDKADSVQVSVTVPDGLMAGSNGVLDSVTVNGGFKTFHWMHRHPIAYYLISVAVSNYYEYTVYANPAGSTGPVPIQNFIYNNTTYLDNYQDDIDETVDFIELFADLYGPYPFQDEKYGHCLAPISGGMEHQTMTTQGYFEKTLTAHELAHQWWGDYVTCGSWADIWLNEGFASYSEYLMLYNLYTVNSAQQKMANSHNNVMSVVGGSTWVADSLNENAIFDSRLVYEKGGAIIHTFRYLINDDVLFFDLLKNYLSTYANSTATGLEFKAFAESYTGMDFSDFFNQWYFGEGYPTYTVRYKPTSSGVLIKINQTTSMPSITPFFSNPIDLKIKRTGLSDTIVRINNTGNETWIDLTTIPNVESITSIDPLNYIINKSGGIILDNNLSIQSVEKNEFDFIIYPNPTGNQLTIQCATNETYTLRLIDQKGRAIISQKIESGAVIDLSQLAAGQYLVELTNENHQFTTRKVIKR